MVKVAVSVQLGNASTTSSVTTSDSPVLEAGGSDHYPVPARILAAGKSLESKAYASAR